MNDKLIKLLPVLSLLIVFFINFISIISIHLSWDNAMQKYLPLQREILSLKNDLSQAHLWFEEAIEGDQSVDIQKDVMTPLKHQSFSLYIQKNEAILTNYNDQLFFKTLKKIETHLINFQLTAQQRWDNSKKHGIGSSLDQKFDSDFNIILALIDRLSRQVKERVDNEIQDRDYYFLWLIALFLLINSAVFSYLFIVRRQNEKSALSLFEEKEKAIITLRSIGDAVITTDKKGNVTFFNDVAEQLTEYKNSDVCGQHIDTVLNIHNVKTDEKIITPISAVLNKGLTKLISNGSKLISKTGKEYIVSDSAAPVRSQSGEIFGTVLVFQNDTERHEIEKILKNSEARYRTLIENIQTHYFFYTHNTENMFTYVSDSITNILGYTAQEFLVHNSTYLTDNAINKKAFEYSQNSVNGIKTEPYLVEVYHKKGTIITLEVTEHPVFNDNNEVISIEGIAKNVTDKVRIEGLINNSQTVLFYWKAEKGWPVEFVSKNITQFGYSVDDFISGRRSFSEIIHPDDLKRIKQEVTLYTNDENDSFKQNYRIIGADGSIFWVEDRTVTERDADNNAIFYLGTIVNITEQKRIESNLESLGYIINESLNEIYVFDKETLKFTYVNQAARNNMGYTLDEMLVMQPYDIKPDYNLESFKQAILPLAQAKQKKLLFETIHERKDGSRYPVEVHLQLIKNNGEEQYVAIILDRTEHKISEAKLQHQAQYDELTDLPNRTLFLDRLSLAIKKAYRSKHQVAVLFIDLDRFKEINDSVGHLFGDEVLKETAERLKTCIRDTDTIARFGGDEFVVLIDDIKDSTSVIDVVQKLMNKMLDPIESEEHKFYLTLSLGISIYPEDGELTETLLKNADAAMYKAKDDGRNNYRFYTAEMTEKAFEHVVMETSLRQALVNNEFIVYYQPQVDARSDNIIGMEALVRWEHPTMGIVSPARFISLAEEIGFIIPLDQWVMKTAMKQIVQWYNSGLNPGVLALNLAVKQLQKSDFIPMLAAMIEETGCKAQWLELEVTEGQIMNNPENAIKILNQIGEMGIKLSVDDFGTGYSSLSYLKRFPIDKLKIDQSFVRDLPDDDEDAAITRAVIALAKSLNLRIIAEGVETEAQKDFLVDNGCFSVQGYLYSKPIPAADMEKLLQK